MKRAVKILLWILLPVLCVVSGGVSGYLVALNMPEKENVAIPVWGEQKNPIKQSDFTTEIESAAIQETEEEQQQMNIVVQDSNTVKDVANLCTKSVVNITIKEESTGYTGGSKYSETVLGHGTGVIIRADGYIVTCHHVIEGADIITVTTDDDKEYDAQLIGSDERFDLAVIRIDEEDMPAVALGNSDIMVSGEEVVVIGNPLGEFGSSVSAGVLSAPTRELTISGTPLRLMQTDAAVNPGNSGGALFNMRGELVGIVNAKMSASGIEGIGFALPWNSIREKVDSIISNGSTGEKAVLGVSTKSTSCYVEDKTVKCLEITTVREGSAAEKAGLKVGDYLLSADGKKLESNDDLTLVIKYHYAGDEVELEVFRDNKKIKITTVLGHD